MKQILFVIIILSAIAIIGCTQAEQEEGVYEPNVGAACNTNEECKTPFEFLVQSNCPFGSACIEGSCKVVCPLLIENEDGCSIDADCDCTTRGDRSISCICKEGVCLSIEAE